MSARPVTLALLFAAVGGGSSALPAGSTEPPPLARRRRARTKRGTTGARGDPRRGIPLRARAPVGGGLPDAATEQAARRTEARAQQPVGGDDRHAFRPLDRLPTSVRTRVGPRASRQLAAPPVAKFLAAQRLIASPPSRDKILAPARAPAARMRRC